MSCVDYKRKVFILILTNIPKNSVTEFVSCIRPYIMAKSCQVSSEQFRQVRELLFIRIIRI